MRKFNKKIVAATLGTALALAASGIAYAYWTETGSGEGTATTGDTQDVTVNQVSTPTDLYPGGPAQALSGTFNNPNDGPVYIASVTATVTGTNKPGCDASDYIVVQPAAVNTEIPAGSGVGSWAGGSIEFNNKADVSQDACKGATVNISYASN